MDTKERWDVVDVLGALAAEERGVEDHDGSAVHDEAHLVPEGAVQPLGEIGGRLGEQLGVRGTPFTSFRAGTVGGGAINTSAKPTRAHG